MDSRDTHVCVLRRFESVYNCRLASFTLPQCCRHKPIKHPIYINCPFSELTIEIGATHLNHLFLCYGMHTAASIRTLCYAHCMYICKISTRKTIWNVCCEDCETAITYSGSTWSWGRFKTCNGRWIITKSYIYVWTHRHVQRRQTIDDLSLNRQMPHNPCDQWVPLPHQCSHPTSVPAPDISVHALHPVKRLCYAWARIAETEKAGDPQTLPPNRSGREVDKLKPWGSDMLKMAQNWISSTMPCLKLISRMSKHPHNPSDDKVHVVHSREARTRLMKTRARRGVAWSKENVCATHLFKI